MNSIPAHKLAALRRHLAAIAAESAGLAPEQTRIGFGLEEVDEAIGGGLPRGALHEVFAAGTGDAAAAEGFALGLALRAAGAGKKLVWIRQELAARENGELYAPGLAEFGLDPDSLILARLRDAVSVLRAANEALRCGALGAVVLDLFGPAKALDLTATRRLARAAGEASVPALLIRTGAEPEPSAAFSRWSVHTAPSRALAANAPGAPVFDIRLLRHRAGFPPRSFRVEWDRDECAFRQPTLPRFVAAPAAHRPAASHPAALRRTG